MNQNKLQHSLTVLFFIIIISAACKKEKTDPDDNSQKPKNYEPDVDSYYLPHELSFISWDFPAVAHTDIDIDYKMTGYDWFDRPMQWMVSEGPLGMYFDPDGTLHWTPQTEGDYSVGIRLTLDGQETIDKNFTICVDDDRCVFISPTGSNSSGDGTIDNPYQFFGEEVAEKVFNLENKCVVYHRGGTYSNLSFEWFNSQGFPFLRKINTMTLTKETPIIVRNYPGEKPVLELNTRGYSFYTGHWIVYGLEFSGGTGPEGACLILYGESVAKRVKAHGYNQAIANNPTGLQLAGNVILDQVEAWDNYDRNDITHHNSSNFLFYGEKAEDKGSGHAFFIDCLSYAYSACGFKVKHAGDETILHIHKSVDIGSLRPIAMAQNHASVRHSVFISKAPYPVINIAVTDPTTNNERHTDGGMLFQENIIISDNVQGFAIRQSAWAMSADTEHPLVIKNNIIESYGAMTGDIFTAGQWTSSTLPDTWNLVFENNAIYTKKTDDMMVVEGVAKSSSDLFSYGDENKLLDKKGTYNFTVAGKNFKIDDGVLIRL